MRYAGYRGWNLSIIAIRLARRLMRALASRLPGPVPQIGRLRLAVDW